MLPIWFLFLNVIQFFRSMLKSPPTSVNVLSLICIANFSSIVHDCSWWKNSKCLPKFFEKFTLKYQLFCITHKVHNLNVENFLLFFRNEYRRTWNEEHRHFLPAIRQFQCPTITALALPITTCSTDILALTTTPNPTVNIVVPAESQQLLPRHPRPSPKCCLRIWSLQALTNVLVANPYSCPKLCVLWTTTDPPK